MKEIILSEKPLLKMILGDCEEYMKTIPDKSFDLAIVDPPYGIGASKNIRKGTRTGNSLWVSGIKYESKNWDSKPPEKSYFDLLFCKSSNQIIWGGNYFMSKIKKDSSCWIVWDKDNGKNEYADCEIAWTSFKTSIRKFKWKWAGMFQEDMKNKQERIHSTEKPIPLYKFCLNKYAKPGQTIFDTHGGSFSSAIACYDLGFDFVGIEIDEEIFELALQRIQNHLKRPKGIFKM